MAQTLILDSEALNALAHRHTRPILNQRARAVLQVAHEERALVRVPAPVLAEVCRGTARDAAILNLLSGRGIVVVSLSDSMARAAGALLEKAKLGSRHAVDAFVVATALSFGASVIATHDPSDIERLATGLRSIRVLRI